MTRISKDGGIDDMVASTQKPIKQVEKVSIRALYPEQEQNSQSHKISYGGPTAANTSAGNIRVD